MWLMPTEAICPAWLRDSKKVKDETPKETTQRLRQTVLDALTAAVENGLPEKGPRGGVIWPARYFVRRVVWHLLDHIWEIEDRIIEPTA